MIKSREKPSKEVRKQLRGVKGELANHSVERKKKLPPKVWIILLLSLVGIYFGARYTVESVIELSTILGIGAEVIAVSAVALGTSLPELKV